MASTSGTIVGTLEGADYGDNSERSLEKGTYHYTLTATDDGKLAFKVETKDFVNGDNWVTREEKSKIRGGTSLTGYFDADSPPAEVATVRFNFNREFLSKGVGYELEFHKH